MVAPFAELSWGLGRFGGGEAGGVRFLHVEGEDAGGGPSEEKIAGSRQSCVQISLLTLGCVATSSDFSSACLRFLICTVGCCTDVVGSLQGNPMIPTTR